MTIPFTRGLHEVGLGIWAWLLPDGTWGWSNAGLIGGEDESLLVDTLFDLALTREMLAAMDPITARLPITHAVNTHANGDHCFGNQLLDPAVRIHAARESVPEMQHHGPPETMDLLLKLDLGPVLTPYVRECFGAFRFDDITLRLPDAEFDDATTLQIGGREVRLMNLGPAHTSADTVVHIPDASVLFAGDLLFIGATPLAWAGPLDSWIAACDTISSLNAEVIVPGHGPITDNDGVQQVRDYLTYVRDAGKAAHAEGKDYLQTAFELDLGPYTTLPNAERIVITMHTLFQEMAPDHTPQDTLTLFLQMSEWNATRGTP